MLLAQAGLTDDLPHEVLLLVVMEAVGPSTTFARSSLVAEALLLRALRGLDSARSRALTAALEHLGESVGSDLPATLTKGGRRADSPLATVTK